MRLLTGAFSDQDCPRFPWARLPRYWTYWSHRLVWTLKPSCSSTAITHCALQLPDCEALATAPATGLPGTTRGPGLVPVDVLRGQPQLSRTISCTGSTISCS